jgi:hypothetical protein
MSHDWHRRAYIDADTLYVIGEAIHFLGELRYGPPDPHTGHRPNPHLLHLLASITLHAQTWMHFLIEDSRNDPDNPLTQDDITHILNGAHPNPVSWCDTP